MLRALVAGLLSMLAVAPPALAQEEPARGDRARGERGAGGRAEPAADRGDWRRARPAMPPQQQQQQPQPQPQPQTSGDRGQRPVRPEMTDGRGGGARGEEAWPRGGPAVRGDAVAGARPPAPDRAGAERERDRGVPGVGRPATGAWGDGAWRSERDRGSYDRPAQGGGVWRSERVESRGRDVRRGDDRAYRLPRYYAPSGWSRGYRRFGVGVRIAPVLFARSYWIDDPWAYRLPDADDRYRWVRYYGDALLVDLDTGQVVDVIYDIFG